MKVSSDVQMLRRKVLRCLLTCYSSRYGWSVLVVSWLWVKVLCPLRNSVEEGHVAFHLLEALLASVVKVSKLLASPVCLLGQRRVWGSICLVETKTDLWHPEVSSLTCKVTSRLLFVVSFKTLVSHKCESPVLLWLAQARCISSVKHLVWCKSNIKVSFLSSPDGREDSVIPVR